MPRRHRSVLLLLLAAAVAFALGRPGLAQIYGEKLPEPYRFASLVADLDAAGVEVPPIVLVDAYRRAIERFAQEQVELRTALRKATGSDVRVYLGSADVDSAFRVIRRARAAAANVEDALFNHLALAVPEESRAAVEQVRGWRSTQRAVPRHFSGPAMYQLADIGDLVRRSGVAGDELERSLAALAPSEGARRSAMLRILKDDEDGRRAAAKLVDEAGLAGKSSDRGSGRLPPEEHAFFTGWHHATLVTGPVIADAIDAQLKAYRAARDVLPRKQRRIVFDGLSPGFIGDQQGGWGIGLPRNARQPSDVARTLLASKELSAAEREAARPIVATWLDEDDDLVLAGLTESVAALRASKDPKVTLTAVQEGIRRLQDRRSELAQRHLPALAKAAGAPWLVDPSMPPPALDEGTMTADDLAAVGIGKPRGMTTEPTSASASRVDLLPAPIDAKSIDEIAAALTVKDDERAVVERILRDHAAMFEATVRPTIETAQTLVRMLAPLGGESASDGDVESAATTLRELRRQAFATADAIDEALAAALVEALGDSSLPAMRRLMAARRLDDSIGQLARALFAVNIDIARAGGSPCTIAATIGDKAVPAAVRGAVEAALSGEWSRALDVAGQVRTTVIDAAFGQAMSRTLLAARANDEGDAGEASASSPNQERRADALIAVLERWQPLEDALATRAIDAAAAAGDDTGALTDAIDRARFGRAYHEVTRIDAAIAALRESADFPGRDALLKELDACRATLAALAKRRADLFRERVRLSTVAPKDRMYVLNDRGGDELGFMLPQWQVYDASTWMIERVAPKEVRAPSADLRGLRRNMGW